MNVAGTWQTVIRPHWAAFPCGVGVTICAEIITVLTRYGPIVVELI